MTSIIRTTKWTCDRDGNWSRVPAILAKCGSGYAEDLPAAARRDEMTKTATFVKDVSAYFSGTAHLFKMSPAVPHSWNPDSEAYDGETEYIVASAVTDLVHETYLFPADENGSVIDWVELDGSQKGTSDIQSVISEAGYSVA